MVGTLSQEKQNSLYIKCKLLGEKLTVVLIVSYHFLTTVDLPFFLCWQRKHGSSVLLCKVQFILEKDRMDGRGMRVMRRKLLKTRGAEQEL